MTQRNKEGSIYGIGAFNEAQADGAPSFLINGTERDNDSFIFDRAGSNGSIKTEPMEFRNELYSSDVVNLYGGSPTELLNS